MDPDHVFTDEQLDMIARHTFDHFERRINEKYDGALEWAQEHAKKELAYSRSRRRIVETITGTAGAAGLIGFLAWLGHVIITTVADYLQNGGI